MVGAGGGAPPAGPGILRTGFGAAAGAARRVTGAGIATAALGGRMLLGGNAQAVTGTIFFFFSAALIFIDQFIFRFNGFKIWDFLRTIQRETAITLLINICVIVLLISLFRMDLNSRNVIRRILLWSMIGFIFFFGFSAGTVFHLAFGIVFWLAILRRIYDGNPEVADTQFILLLLIDFFFAPAIASISSLGYAGTINLEVFDNLKILFAIPIYFLYILFSPHVELSGLMRLFGYVIIIGLIVTMLPANFSMAYSAEVKDFNRFQVVMEGWEDFKVKATLMYQELRRGINKTYNEQMYQFTGGGYYEGQVDDNTNEKIGVYLENVRSLDKKFYEGDKISIWGDIKAKTIGNDNPITVAVGCIADKHEKEPIMGEVRPERNFTIYSFEEENINCDFEPGTLDKGTHYITLYADFDFQTLSYLKTYFMSEENIRSLTKDTDSVFDFYNVKDKDPKAIYTNGPVMLGIETRKPPIALTSDFDSDPYIGFTIENRWSGTILQLKDLELQIPSGAELDLGSCNQDLFVDSPESREGFNVYHTDPKITTLSKYQNIEGFVSFACRLKIKAEDAESFLTQPLTTKFIRLTASYIYRLEKEVPVKITTVPGFSLLLEPSAPRSKDNIICKARHTSKDIEEANAKFFVNGEEVLESDMDCAETCSATISHEFYRSGDYVRCAVQAVLDDQALVGGGERAGSTSPGESLVGDEEIKKYDAYSSIGVKIKESAPDFKITFNPEKAVTKQDLECSVKLEDSDGYEFKDALYEISSGFYDTGSVSCSDNECKVTIEGKELQAGERIICKWIVTKNENSFEDQDSITINAED